MRSAIIALIPAERIENELPVFGAAIFERLAANRIKRDFWNELRPEFIKRIRILAARPTMGSPYRAIAESISQQ